MIAATRRSVVIFDLGGVLLDWNPRYLYRKLIADEAACETFLTEVCPPEWNVARMPDAASPRPRLKRSPATPTRPS